MVIGFLHTYSSALLLLPPPIYMISLHKVFGNFALFVHAHEVFDEIPPPSIPKPSPPISIDCPPPPASPSSGGSGGGSGYYYPPPPNSDQGPYYTYPPPYSNYPTPGPPNPIMPYFPYYYYSPPPPGPSAADVLLYGPPGTGKTLLARAIATNIDANFLKVVSSAIIDKYIGESARLIREMFSYARDHQPCIIFMDEIDAIGGRRFSEGTSADREIQRTLMELLNQLDGFDQLGNVKMIMATNRPDVLDPDLLRPGRLDRKIEIPLPNEQSRMEILKIHAAGIAKHGEIDYEIDDGLGALMVGSFRGDDTSSSTDNSQNQDADADMEDKET
ncbi:unnamed protein product [Lactuca virosa]|uniref:AAA+ ATPase domain-containing protein n=1 Tax=Lactuca virosa TaxID=75947 RepID=A0AAU9PSA8_9ASTR|nr:unnamed protein product [Lactuca virosa]